MAARTFQDVLEIGKAFGLDMNVENKGDTIVVTLANPSAEAVEAEVSMVTPLETWPKEIVGDYALLDISPRTQGVSVSPNSTVTLTYTVTPTVDRAKVGAGRLLGRGQAHEQRPHHPQALRQTAPRASNGPPVAGTSSCRKRRTSSSNRRRSNGLTGFPGPGAYPCSGVFYRLAALFELVYWFRRRIGGLTDRGCPQGENRMSVVQDRCRRCILPTSYPRIRFDEEGICNFCRLYDERWGQLATRGPGSRVSGNHAQAGP